MISITRFIIAKWVIKPWCSYWAMQSEILPSFINHVLKGTLIYAFCMVCILYVSAWVIYGMPPTENAFFVLCSTLLSLFADFPSFIVRLFTKAPVDMSYEQILYDAIAGYIRSYFDFVVSTTLINFITGFYIWFLFKTCLHYRRSNSRWDRTLSNVILFFLGLSVLVLFYYYTLPFIKGVFEEGLALRIIKLCWRFVSWVLNLNPYAKEKRNVQFKTNANQTTSNNTNSKSSNFGGRAYSPSEEQPKRTWADWAKGKKASSNSTCAAPSQPKESPPIMGSRSGAQQMAEANYTLGRQIRYGRQESLEKLDELMKNPEKNKSEIDYTRGQIAGYNTSEEFHAQCTYRQAQVLSSTTHLPQDPQNLTEAGQRALAVAAERSGQAVGDLTEKAAKVAYNRTMHPEGPPSPRAWDE